jgi:hypothetical protein
MMLSGQALAMTWGPADRPDWRRDAATGPGRCETTCQEVIVSQVRVHNFSVSLDGLFGLNRALSWLRDNSDSLDIEVAVRVAAEQSGIDPVRLRNGCLEPLEEGGTQITDQEMS